jgi:hypothetical protein
MILDLSFGLPPFGRVASFGLRIWGGRDGQLMKIRNFKSKILNLNSPFA